MCSNYVMQTLPKHQVRISACFSQLSKVAQIMLWLLHGQTAESTNNKRMPCTPRALLGSLYMFIVIIIHEGTKIGVAEKVIQEK